MRDSLSPACISVSSSSECFLLFFLRPFPSSSSSPQPFLYSSCSPHRRFHLSPLLPLRGGCRERFFFFFSHHCCREEELVVKRLRGALRRFLWRATPSSIVEGASSPSTVEVSAITMSFPPLLPELGWSDRVDFLSVRFFNSLRIKLIRKFLMDQDDP